MSERLTTISIKEFRPARWVVPVLVACLVGMVSYLAFVPVTQTSPATVASWGGSEVALDPSQPLPLRSGDRVRLASEGNALLDAVVKSDGTKSPVWLSIDADSARPTVGSDVAIHFGRQSFAVALLGQVPR